ncbi:DNA repair exonuclease [Alkalibaculum sp. M08DMB]|uniref:DNA repair exonuclease n=1 Tax=Alkalibaculum sporogenes TaxID=2655001 RepID=A0A6A7K6N5_9FIRM|nr:DNA repair exonuclease [Alkalibaculum sporogenes]MPW24877.1 DNA repair exonuclease [Alkalibaculum sporogenes]
MKIKFIHTADIHLGSRFNNASFPGDIAKIRRQEMWSTFHDIVSLAHKEKVDFLFISGDLFESELITLGDLKRINEAFKSIQDTQILITPGNHDTYGEKSPYKLISWSENVNIFKAQELSLIEFTDLNTNIYGFAWSEKYISNEFRYNMDPLDKDKNNILMLHGDIYNKKSNYFPIDKNYLKKLSFDYVALGHVHKPDIQENGIVYPGSPEPLDFGEIGSHGVILGQLQDSRVQTKFITMSKRQFLNEELYLHPEMTYQEIINIIQSYHGRERNLYRLSLLGLVDSDIDMDQVINDVNKEFYYIEINNQVEPDYDLDKIMNQNSDNIIGLFIKEMRKKDLEDIEVKNALYLGLQALLKEKV